MCMPYGKYTTQTTIDDGCGSTAGGGVNPLVIERLFVFGFSVGTAIGTTIGVLFSDIFADVADLVDSSDELNNKNNNQAYFPLDPYLFSPKGLVRREFPGTTNGRIFKWFDPATNTPIFEWDEDFQYGSHYHILVNGEHVGDHRKAGEEIPEPWNSLYFN